MPPSIRESAASIIQASDVVRAMTSSPQGYKGRARDPGPPSNSPPISISRTMSYAAVAAHNAPPPSRQPHADQALFTTERPTADNIADDAAKLNLVSADFKTNPATVTSEQDVPRPARDVRGAPTTTEKRAKGRRYLHEAEEESSYLWHLAQQYILHPAVAGGLMGLGEQFCFIRLHTQLKAYCSQHRPYWRRDVHLRHQA